MMKQAHTLHKKLCKWIPLSICLAVFSGIISPLYAQQYATDWVYLRHQNRTNCRASTERKIDQIKKRPSMNNEHDKFINRFVQNRRRADMPINSKQRLRLLQLAGRKQVPPRQTNRQILMAKMSRYEWMRKRCK